MSGRSPWTRQQLFVAFNLYCQLPFGKFHSRNPEIIQYAKMIGRTPSALAMKLTNIASLDPVITSSGRSGLKGASALDRSMWDEMQDDWDGFVLESHQVISEFTLSFDKPQEDDESLPLDYSGTSRPVSANARVGQSFFRNAVLSAYGNRCCITGLSVPRLLIASHIVPWSKDRKNRLNPSNGLALSMLHDKAFDIGLITIDEDRAVQVSQQEWNEDDLYLKTALLSFHGQKIQIPDKFVPNAQFLEYHRENIYIG